MQQRTESTVALPEPAANAVAAAIARLGAVMPSKAEPAPVADGGQPAESVGKLVIPALSPAQRRRRVAFKVAAVVSLLLHVGSLVVFLGWNGADIGAIERPSDAISVEIVASRTLEAMIAKQIAEPAPSAEATAPVEGKAETSEAPAVKSDPPAEPEAEPQLIEPPPPIDVPETAQGASRSARQEPPEKSEAPPRPIEGPTQVVPPPPKTEAAEENAAKRREQKVERNARERAPKGGITSKARTGKGTGGERASASSGSILSYAAHVRARVAANKPSGGDLHGAAVVSFGVTTSGGLAYASLARSSGNSTLDQMAVAAVRGAAPFPTPPPGATPAQLRFTIPFYFE